MRKDKTGRGIIKTVKPLRFTGKTLKLTVQPFMPEVTAFVPNGKP